MANIPLTGSGAFFTKIGHIIQAVNNLSALAGGPLSVDGRGTAISETLVTRFNTLEADYAAGSAEYPVIDGSQAQLASFQQVYAGTLSYLQTLAQATVVDMAGISLGFTTGVTAVTLPQALALLISQMVGGTFSSPSNTLTASTLTLGAQTNGTITPVGNPTVVTSGKSGRGQALGTLFLETITLVCTQDAQTGGASPNQEQITISGATAQGNPLAFNWPQGSGAAQTLTVVDCTQNNAGGNNLANSDFLSYSNPNIPDNWIAGVGTIGTQILGTNGASSNGYIASTDGAVEFVGDSATLTALVQPFNTATSTASQAGGSPFAPQPDTPYAVNLWFKLSSASPTAGTLALSLYNASNTVINDDMGNANQATQSLHAIADTSFHNLSAVFRLPATLPSAVKLAISLSAALTTGTNLYISHVAMNTMTQLYAGGPWFSIFSGSVKPLLNDTWTVTVSGSYGALVHGMERLFGLNALGLVLPTAVPGSVADSLVA